MSAVISVENVHKTFRSGFLRKKAEVLRGVSLEVSEGEIFGFIGPNGAGKTTMIKVLLGLIFPTSGRAQILSRDAREVDFKKHIGFLPDNPYFYSYLTGEEFLDFYAHLFGLPAAKRRQKIDALLKLVDLERARKLQLRKYSKGMLQRIGMAQALINDPKIVIMDEPTSGLDPVGRKQIRDIIVGLKAEGKTVFFSTHILSDVEMICDRVAILVKGQIRGQGLLTDLLRAKVRSVEIIARNVSPDLLTTLEKNHPQTTIRGGEVLLSAQEADTNAVLNLLISKKAEIVSVMPHRESLEELFMSEIR